MNKRENGKPTNIVCIDGNNNLGENRCNKNKR
jgi:hypothetical protein